MHVCTYIGLVSLILVRQDPGWQGFFADRRSEVVLMCEGRQEKYEFAVSVRSSLQLNDAMSTHH